MRTKRDDSEPPAAALNIYLVICCIYAMNSCNVCAAHWFVEFDVPARALNIYFVYIHNMLFIYIYTIGATWRIGEEVHNIHKRSPFNARI